MDIKKIRKILGWCAVLNYVLIFLGAALYLLIDQYVYRFSQAFYPINEDWFNLVIIMGLAIWEILIWVFFIVPWIVLCFMYRD